MTYPESADSNSIPVEGTYDLDLGPQLAAGRIRAALHVGLGVQQQRLHLHVAPGQQLAGEGHVLAGVGGLRLARHARAQRMLAGYLC